MTEQSTHRRVGLWLIGARGAISTCVAYGLAGLREGLLDPLGLVTARAPFSELDLAPFDSLVLGGHDVTRRGLGEAAGELARLGVLHHNLVAAASSDAAAFESRVRPGLLDGLDVGIGELDPEASRLGALGSREQVEHVRADLRAFQEEHGLATVVVVNLASTEAAREPAPEWGDLEAFESALDAGTSQPASMLYAYAAIGAGFPYVNFTPNIGASPGAIRQLAERERVPHCGSDAKTGETLVKTVLAPMYVARNLRVLSWQGYNMLGNRDGEVLVNPTHKQSKLTNKDEALRSILGDPNTHSHVGIDFVPSLGDWKTAWDFIHFEGFLGARMSLSFQWQGSDSALAAPLVLDLARLVDLSARLGEFGALDHTASFFKSPIAGGTHDFHAQFEVLDRWARERAGAPQAGGANPGSPDDDSTR